MQPVHLNISTKGKFLLSLRRRRNVAPVEEKGMDATKIDQAAVRGRSKSQGPVMFERRF